ncbi:hypothetical protein AAK979_00560 [Ileibacterium valens]|uniref:hypothetical protein n=1 Tax=Ileibacterium valens TaxID=1862668 RepID=UPI0035152601
MKKVFCTICLMICLFGCFSPPKEPLKLSLNKEYFQDNNENIIKAIDLEIPKDFKRTIKTDDAGNQFISLLDNEEGTMTIRTVENELGQVIGIEIRGKFANDSPDLTLLTENVLLKMPEYVLNAFNVERADDFVQSAYQEMLANPINISLFKINLLGNFTYEDLDLADSYAEREDLGIVFVSSDLAPAAVSYFAQNDKYFEENN